LVTRWERKAQNFQRKAQNFQRKAQNFLGFVQLGCIIILLRRL